MQATVEKPPHVDPGRIVHIRTEDLLAALDFSNPHLAEVQRAVAARDYDLALERLRAHFAKRAKSRPMWDLQPWDVKRWAETADNPQEPLSAEGLVRWKVDFLDPSLHRTHAGLHYLDWLHPLLRAYAASPDERFVRAFGRIFEAWYEWEDKESAGTYSGLDAVWYSLGVWARSRFLSSALHIFGHEGGLTTKQWRDIMATIVGGARWACEEHDTFKHGNWQFACCAELLQAGALLSEFAESRAWRDTARARILDHLEIDVYADGGHYERSPGYHTMPLEELQRAAVTAEQLLDWRLSDHPRFRAMHEWLLHMSTPQGWIVPFQDSYVVRPALLFLRGHYFLGDPVYKALAQRWLSAEEIEQELKLLPRRPGASAEPREVFHAASAAEPDPSSSELATSGYAIFRQGWGDDDLFTAVNYGPFVGHELEPHSHRAVLDFAIVGWGSPLAWEAGGPASYDDPLYHSWYQSVRSHNTVAWAGLEPKQERRAAADSLVFLPQIDFFAGHHDGYPVRHQRKILFVRAEPSYWCILDDLPGAPSTAWQIHGVKPWKEVNGGLASSFGPGLLVLLVDPELVRHVERGTGPSRTGEIHSLRLHQDVSRHAVVVVPFRDDPPAASAKREGTRITVKRGGFVDQIRGDAWLRHTRAGELAAAATWSEAPLSAGGETLVECEAQLSAGVTYGAAVDAVINTSGRANLELFAPYAQEISLNKVRLPVERNGSHISVILPSAGRWCVQASPHNR